MPNRYKISQGRLDRAFLLLETAARNGERCPHTARTENVQGERRQIPGLAPGTTTVLAERGLIRVEIFSRNFRRITILVGEHAGRSTADHPFGALAKPYRVLDNSDHHRPQNGGQMKLRFLKLPPNPTRRIAP